MKMAIWLSFDLGVRGDYEGFYTWLDSKGAIECGNGFAFFKYDVSEDIVERLKKDIEENVEVNKKTRIYIVYRDEKTQKMKGQFILGARKDAPWSGYAGNQNQIDEEEE